jgi:hypothetical protein
MLPRSGQCWTTWDTDSATQGFRQSPVRTWQLHDASRPVRISCHRLPHWSTNKLALRSYIVGKLSHLTRQHAPCPWDNRMTSSLSFDRDIRTYNVAISPPRKLHLSNSINLFLRLRCFFFFYQIGLIDQSTPIFFLTFCVNNFMGLRTKLCIFSQFSAKNSQFKTN